MLRIMSHPIEIMKLLVGGDMDFSLEEKKVGAWIDGKPVYQRTFQIASSTPQHQILTDTNDIKRIIYTTGSYIRTSICTSPFYSSANEWVLTTVQDNNIHIFFSTGHSYTDIIITCLYIKTTD